MAAESRPESRPSLASRSERAAAGRDSRPSEPPQDDDDDVPEFSNTCVAVTVAIIAALVGLVSFWGRSPADPLDTRVAEFKDDEMLRVVVWPGQAGGTHKHRGPNGRDTDWAVFFYRPYCGACKRVWPVFRALGATTNASGRLRFGEVNCVRDRGVCSMQKADKQPLIRIYRAVDHGDGPRAPKMMRRAVIREWSGLLIAYEVVDWFHSLQSGPNAIYDAGAITWPQPDELADAMRRFKTRGKTQHDSSLSRRPADPAGYLVDAELALAHGLTDHVFPHHDMPLEGQRLAAMLSWLDLQASAFPRADVRRRVGALRARLANRPRWERSKFETAVRAQGFDVSPPPDSAWRWCDTSGGRGGYTCGLWVLFHATMANVARPEAPGALEAIAGWVNDFFGCEECARHFAAYLAEHAVDERAGQIGAVLWLWRAHNAVTDRLRTDELKADGASERTRIFPSPSDCEPCYNASKGEDAPVVFDASAEQSVFEYLQEVYCFESDTFVCAGFDDPSKDKKSRLPPPEKPAAEPSAAQ